jgi:hypothetical protein
MVSFSLKSFETVLYFFKNPAFLASTVLAMGLEYMHFSIKHRAQKNKKQKVNSMYKVRYHSKFHST